MTMERDASKPLPGIIGRLQSQGVDTSTISELMDYMARTRWDAVKEAALDGEWPVTKIGFANELNKHKDRIFGLSAAIMGMRHSISDGAIHVDGVQRIALDIELSAMRLQHIYGALFDRKME